MDGDRGSDMTGTTAVKLQIGAALTALVVVAFGILQVSQAAFSGTTDSSGNWDAATVALSDDDGGQVAFTNDNRMVPADSDRACITVTYDGDVASTVKLYGSTTFTSSSDLGQYLDLAIDEVTVGAGTCDAPDASTPIYTGTVSVNAGAFAVAHNDWSDGLASNWAPSTSGASQVYRITVTLQDDNGAQGLDTTAVFNWEAQNT